VEGRGGGNVTGRSSHPLPALPPPPGCPRPSTAEYHVPPHPPPACADVWPALPEALARWEARLPALRAEAAAFWAAVRRGAACAVGALVRHGAEWRRHAGGADLPPHCRVAGPLWPPRPPALLSQSPRNEPTPETSLPRSAAKGAAAVAASGGSSPAAPVGAAESRRADPFVISAHYPVAATAWSIGASPVSSRTHAVPTWTSPPPSPRHPPLPQPPQPPSGQTASCHHHDLRCRAREVAAAGVDEATHAVLHGSIADARAMAGALFTRSPAATGSWSGIDVRGLGSHPEERRLGQFPTGPCEHDCDCAGAAACGADGMCTHEAEGHCLPPAGSAGALAIARFVEVLHFCTQVQNTCCSPAPLNRSFLSSPLLSSLVHPRLIK
jgi:hypothetical protein